MPNPARVAAVVALLALTGCGAPPAPVPAAAPAPVLVAAEPAPTSISIPAIDAASTLIGLGRTPDGRAEVPPVTEPAQASWYQPGVRPGATGPAVILGHVSGRPPGAVRSVPGVFAHLDQLTPGDDILIGRADGTTAVFQVTEVQTHPKTAFPVDAVWGDTTTPALRLITCGGVFDEAARSFDSNVIVFAALAGLR